MSETHTKYPWLNIVQFHKEIIELDQEDIFKFLLDKGGYPDQTRCAHLKQFHPDVLADTWTIPEGRFGSTPLLNEIKEGKLTEGYLGGPCWAGWDPRARTAYLSPLLYQHVQIQWSDEENAIVIIPDEGRWDLPPFLFERLDRLEFSPDTPLESLPFSIIEKAHLRSESEKRSISECILSEARSQIPVIESPFSSSTPGILKENPDPWVFFTFPSSGQSRSMYLLPDYNTLESCLAAEPDTIGGFRVFEGILNPDVYKHSEVTVDPIIPLNRSQEAAVQGIIDKKPVTVISGPPGCGKSQVVVSLLLNAWAQGKSVLFASTTKAAVDVVFDRLKDFECEYPIAIRAGGKERNTIAESLDKLKYLSITQSPSPREMSSIEKQIAKIYAEQQELQKFIDDRIPQRITQAKQAGWKAYLEAQKIGQEIERDREPFAKKIASIGYRNVAPESFADEVCRPLKAWLEGIDGCRYLIQNDDDRRREYQEKIARLEQERDQILKGLGYADPASTDCRWLLERTGVEQFTQWLKIYRTLLAEDAEQPVTIELTGQYRQWTGEEDARQWVDRAGALVEKIRQYAVRHSDTLNEYPVLLQRYETAKKNLAQARLPEQPPVDRNPLDEWRSAYAYSLTLPEGILALMKRRASENQLQQYEKKFGSYFPDDVWSAIKADSRTGRQRLNGLIDQVLQWSAIQKEWEDFGAERERIKTGLKEIVEDARSLNLPIPNPRNGIGTMLREISGSATRGISVAKNAAEAWKSHGKREKIRGELLRHVIRLDSLVAGSPILAAWTGGPGYEFSRVVAGLKTESSPEQIFKARMSCSDHQISTLTTAWQEAINQQKEIALCRSDYASVPSRERRIADWWNKKPRCCAPIRAGSPELPCDGDVLHRHLEECEKIAGEWETFSNGEYAVKLAKREEMRDSALENLTISYNSIPASLCTPEIKKVLIPLVQQSGEELQWISSADERVFNNFNPDRIRARIAQLNSRLGELSFTLAKMRYLQRIESGSYVLEDLDALYRHFKSNRYQAKGFPKEKYINALKAAPIWMTNAHQPQSFPMAPEIFDVLIIDEASQCTLTNILPLIYRARSLAVIGDRDQLPAIMSVQPGKETVLAAKHGIADYRHTFGHNDNVTMFDLGLEFVPGGRKNVIHLVEHYRSHPLIIGFSNLYIYQMRLSLRRETIQAGKSLPSGVFGLDVRGECVQKGTSWVNPKEAEQVCNVIEEIRRTDDLMHKTIGVVTPFVPQKQQIVAGLEEKSLMTQDILVDTVDAFQGSERDIIIFSPVVSKGMKPGTAKWSDNKNRINVALTRARDLLVVVADFDHCRRQDQVLGKLIEYVETVSTLRNTSMEELELFSLMLMEGNELKITRSNMPRIHQRVGSIEVDFILRNPEKGVDVVVEVDGKQHYYVEVEGAKHPVKYTGMKRYLELEGEKHYLYVLDGKEYVEIGGMSYPVVQTADSVVHDTIRDSFLRSEGYKVLRIHTQDIREKPAVIMNDLKKALEIIE